jgi:hypothetical protein
MEKRRRTKLHQTLGIARLVVILTVLALVLVAAALYPVIQHYRFRADALGCLAGLDTARRQLSAEYLFVGENSSAEQARDYVGFVMAGCDDLCPSGGTTYIVPKDDSELAWDVVCGLHGQDRRQCTRLNADYVLEQLREELRTAQVLGTTYPERMTVTLHHKPLEALITEKDTGLRRGTRATVGAKGTLVSYVIAGYSDFGTCRGVPVGEISWFSYADEEHCANWSAWDGWTGDSYSDVIESKH